MARTKLEAGLVLPQLLRVSADDQSLARQHERTPDQAGLVGHQREQLLVVARARRDAALACRGALPREELVYRRARRLLAQLVDSERALENVALREGHTALREQLPRPGA